MCQATGARLSDFPGSSPGLWLSWPGGNRETQPSPAWATAEQWSMRVKGRLHTPRNEPASFTLSERRRAIWGLFIVSHTMIKQRVKCKPAFSQVYPCSVITHTEHIISLNATICTKWHVYNITTKLCVCVCVCARERGGGGGGEDFYPSQYRRSYTGKTQQSHHKQKYEPVRGTFYLAGNKKEADLSGTAETIKKNSWYLAKHARLDLLQLLNENPWYITRT